MWNNVEVLVNNKLCLFALRFINWKYIYSVYYLNFDKIKQDWDKHQILLITVFTKINM